MHILTENPLAVKKLGVSHRRLPADEGQPCDQFVCVDREQRQSDIENEVSQSKRNHRLPKRIAENPHGDSDEMVVIYKVDTMSKEEVAEKVKAIKKASKKEVVTISLYQDDSVKAFGDMLIERLKGKVIE